LSHHNEPQKSSKQRAKNIIAYSSLGMQVAITVFLFAVVGRWLDNQYNLEKRWFTLVFVLAGVALSIYTVIRQLNQFNKNS
jgi:F0F1-type ATP synthase assembly protein I